ncbi:MAG: adenosylcobinamide-GDP ribazoletransferase, partial [Hyphomicrobiaceae bacterium]
MMDGVLPRGLIVALQFLTRLPTPALGDFSSDDTAASAKWYPLVGLIVGGLVACVYWAGHFVTPWFAALCTVLVWIWITGALHLDGLADTADGLGAAHRDPARFLEVVRDPNVGSFGVIALVLVIAAKLILLAGLPSLAIALALVPAWARWGPTVWRNLVPPLGDGRGKDFSAHQDWRWVAANGAVLVAASLWFAPALLLSL